MLVEALLRFAKTDEYLLTSLEKTIRRLMMQKRRLSKLIRVAILFSIAELESPAGIRAAITVYYIMPGAGITIY